MQQIKKTDTQLSKINLDSVKTYMEIVFVFLLMTSGTYFYTLRDKITWIAPFIVLSYGIVLSALALYQYYQTVSNNLKEDDILNNKPRTLGAGFIWVLWLVYGIVFRDISPLFESISYIQSAIVILIVLLTYWKRDITENPIWANTIFFMVTLLLFIPHGDTISHDMNHIILFLKIGIFYFLYVITEIYHVLDNELQKYNTSYNSSSRIVKYKSIYKTEIKIVQSAWVLLASKYLLIGSVIQLFPLIIELQRVLKKNKEQKNAFLSKQLSVPRSSSNSSSSIVKKPPRTKKLQSHLVTRDGSKNTIIKENISRQPLSKLKTKQMRGKGRENLRKPSQSIKPLRFKTEVTDSELSEMLG